MTTTDPRDLKGQYLIRVSRVQTFSVIANSQDEAIEMCLDGVLIVDQIDDIATVGWPDEQ